MTSELYLWLNGAPVIPAGDSDFLVWLNGAPVVDTGWQTEGPPPDPPPYPDPYPYQVLVCKGGARIVSPRQQTGRSYFRAAVPAP